MAARVLYLASVDLQSCRMPSQTKWLSGSVLFVVIGGRSQVEEGTSVYLLPETLEIESGTICKFSQPHPGPVAYTVKESGIGAAVQ